MKIVQSYWFGADPAASNWGGFGSERHFWYSWVISTSTLARYYPVELVTDSYGAERVNELALTYRSVSRALDTLPVDLNDLWVLGKLHAYSLQSEPFLHIDLDAFVWARFPEEIERAKVVVQYLEDDPRHEKFYLPLIQEMRAILPNLPEGYRAKEALNKCLALNCGVFGGSDLDFISQYAAETARIIMDAGNRDGWNSLRRQHPLNFIDFNAAVEQVNLQYCCARIGLKPTAVVENAFSPGRDIQRERLAFTHLVGPEKARPEVHRMLEDRMRKSFAEYLPRVEKILLK